MNRVIEWFVPRPFLDLCGDTFGIIAISRNIRRVSPVRVAMRWMMPAWIKKIFHIKNPVKILKDRCFIIELERVKTLMRVSLFVLTWIVRGNFGLMMGVGISFLSLPAGMVSVGGFFLSDGILEMVALRSFSDLVACLFTVSIGYLLMQNYTTRPFGIFEYCLSDLSRIRQVLKIAGVYFGKDQI